MEKYVDLIRTWIAGLILILGVTPLNVVKITAQLLQTLGKKTLIAIILVMLVTMMLIMMEYPTVRYITYL